MPDHFLARAIQRRFHDRLAASPRGRVFILKFLVAAEAGDEAGVFDHLLARVEDPALQAMVRKHRDDELRHADVFRACLGRQGIAAAEVPEPPGIIQRIDREVGGFAEAFLADRTGVMEAYVLLGVIEERGVAEYPVIAGAIAPYDPEVAAVIQAVADEETRHVRYAKAISARYAPDPDVLAATYLRFRAAEARAFAQQGRDVLAQAVEHELLEVGRLERAAWRALVALGRRRAAPEV